MTAANSLPAGREVVLLTHLLPQWIGSEIDAAFDLRLVDLACEPCRRARVMITPGPARVDAGLLAELPALEYIAAIGSGIEGIDTAYASRRGIAVTNSAAATAEDVADHTLALTLALHARIINCDQSVRAGSWPAKALRRSLSDSHVGIVGLGAIGTAVARRLAPLGCAIRWHGPRGRAAPYDYVADLGALKDGRLGGAALDVFQVEPTPGARWRDVPNTVLTPHIGGFASGVQRKIQQLLSANLQAFFAGRAHSGVVGPYRGVGA